MAAGEDASLPAPATKPERLSWTPAEDRIIVHSVNELGHKWFRIAQRLPGRTEHAIRNRYHRLQSAMADAQQQAMMSDAVSEPVILPVAMPVGA